MGDAAECMYCEQEIDERADGTWVAGDGSTHCTATADRAPHEPDEDVVLGSSRSDDDEWKSSCPVCGVGPGSGQCFSCGHYNG